MRSRVLVATSLWLAIASACSQRPLRDPTLGRRDGGTAGVGGAPGDALAMAGAGGVVGDALGMAGTEGQAASGGPVSPIDATMAGTTGAAGSPPATGVCDGAGTRFLPINEGAIDNFETAALSPAWATFNDVEVGGQRNTIKMALGIGGALGTAHAAHYAGSGARPPSMGGYGVGAVYNAAIDKVNRIFCVDVTAFDGITFWAKGKPGIRLGVDFIIPETNMAPDGDCTLDCFNHPQVTVALAADWAQYSIPFAAAVTGAFRVTGRIQQVAWLSPDSDWDYWLDEIQLYKGAPPTTPVR